MDEAINFIYEDADSYQNEISELYSYSEEVDFFANRNAFEETMEDYGLPLTWKHMVPEQKWRTIHNLMAALEVSCRTTRLKSCRALAYLVQGNFGECLTLEEQAINSQENVFMLYEQGILQSFIQLLILETNTSFEEERRKSTTSNPGNTTFSDSAELRLIFSVLCTLTETMYHAKDSTNPKIQELREQFIQELQCPEGEDSLMVFLFQMLNDFCGGTAPHYPVKKITLFMWKILLITLGGVANLKEKKNEKRKLIDLDPVPDDTMEVTKNMRHCTPPLGPDGQVRQAAKSANFSAAGRRKVLKQSAFDGSAMTNYEKREYSEFENDSEMEAPTESKDKNLLDKFYKEMEKVIIDPTDTPFTNGDYNEAKDVTDSSESFSSAKTENSDVDLTSRDFEKIESEEESVGDIKSGDGSKKTDVVNEGFPYYLYTPNKEEYQTYADTKQSRLKCFDEKEPSLKSDVTYKGLPWAPKVRKSDLIQHINALRQKFFGYSLENDTITTFNLPDPIIEGINVIKKRLYTSLSEIQLEREEKLYKFPLVFQDTDPNYAKEPAEKLYRSIFLRLPQHLISLLKVLLAAATTNKNKTEKCDSINIMAEISLDNGISTIVQAMKMNADVGRHKEIIIKAVSGIIILLLKHFKVNHTYQFEYTSQQLMFANCIPLILKILSQDMSTFVLTPKTTISVIDFPACVIGEQSELTTEAIELYSFQPYCWRNMFSSINLVRILNKLVKWKHSRIMMLVVFKSSVSLTKALNIRHAMFQVYVLKLLKVQLKFLGRQWKKANMPIMSAIYQKVRHRLTDDWAFCNDNEAKPWDFQAEEFKLQTDIMQFHGRRYQKEVAKSGINLSQLSNSIEIFKNISKESLAIKQQADEGHDLDIMIENCGKLTENFEKNYELWLEDEVFRRNIDWDMLCESIKSVD